MRSRLRSVIFVVIVAAQVATVAALVLVSGRLTSAAESRHTDALLENIATESAARIQAHILPAEWIVTFAGDLATAPAAGRGGFPEAFRDALELSPQLAGAFIATPDGGFTYVSRHEDGYRLKTITVDESGTTTRLDFYDVDGTMIGQEDDPTDDYDPTSRPWYRAAIATPGEAVWTDPYVFFTSRELGITAAKTIEFEGETIGVIGADIELGSLSEFLATRPVGDHGGTVIMNEAGTVIAHQDTSLIQVAEGDSYRTVAIGELDDPYARGAVAAVIGSGVSEGSSATFESDELGPSRAVFRSVPVGAGEWSIGVFGPDGDLVGDLRTARVRERWLAVAVGALAMIIVGSIAFRATRPIRALEKRAMTDPLTGLPNRRAILEKVEALAVQTEPRAAAMIDLDFFKNVNDDHGHPTGDLVLRDIAQRIALAIPAGATVGRMGGEEFLVTLPACAAVEAELVGESIRYAIASSPIATPFGSVSVTASIGIAVVAEPCEGTRLITTADEALLRAKHAGRNRVEVDPVNPVLDPTVPNDELIGLATRIGPKPLLHVTRAEAAHIAAVLHVEFDTTEFDIEQFTAGIQAELAKHHRRVGEGITHDELFPTSKMALANLTENPHYYSLAQQSANVRLIDS